MPFEFPFPNPATPDLGCFIRRKHELETEPGNIHVEFQPSLELAELRQQIYFRVMCGKAGFFQRALVFMTPDLSVPGPILENFPPDFVLGGDFTPSPSEWVRYPMQTGHRVYWFFGQHRNPASGPWRPDKIVGHTYDIYDNGTLSTVHYDDTGADQDMNDFILQVAAVRRDRPEIILIAEGQTEVFEQFKRDGLQRQRLKKVGR